MKTHEASCATQGFESVMRLHKKKVSARMKENMDTGFSLSGPEDQAQAEALDWFVRRTDGLNAAEEQVFQQWLRLDVAHALAYAQWEGDWLELDAAPVNRLDQLRANLARDKHLEQSRLATRQDDAQPGWLQRTFDALFSPRSMLAGACMTVLVASVLAWSYWWQPVFSQTYATARGEQTEVNLPDGSRMQLDTATQTNVALYRGHRNVRVPEGQARFQVKGDAGRPFNVLAGPLRITVVGTRFAVRYTPDIPGHDGVRVAVEEGRVRVARAGWFGDKGEVELTAGQQIVSNANGTLGVVSNVALADVAPWRESRISFDNIPLKQVLAEFERYGDTQLQLADAHVAALRLTGTFDPNNLQNFMRVLPYALPVHLSKAGSVTEIRADK